ncbi:MAG: hypothetical protein MKZ95_14230 [Pirellulales bacterium]|nr:hypothetical protein [Pirellulales bacterium]
MSSRNSACRVEPSGPWQLKQASEKIGRIYQPNLRGSWPSAAAAQTALQQSEACAKQINAVVVKHHFFGATNN